MTLCFSQDQAAAVYSATKGAKEPVYVSPFVGRLDDRGTDGMDVVRKYSQHVSSRRPSRARAGCKHPASSIICSAPSRCMRSWRPCPARCCNSGPPRACLCQTTALCTRRSIQKGSPKPIAYKELDLNAPWESFDLRHELTKKEFRSSLPTTKARFANRPDAFSG